MIYRSTDQIGRRYLDLMPSRVGLKANDLVASKGEVCVFCGGPSSRIRRGRFDSPGRWRWVLICAVCRQPWEGVHFEILKRWVQESPTVNMVEQSMITRIDEWAALRPIVETPARKDDKGIRFLPGRWQFSVTAWLLYIDPTSSTYPAVVDRGRDEFCQFGDLWSEKRVRDAVHKARGVIKKRAVDASLIPAMAR